VRFSTSPTNTSILGVEQGDEIIDVAALLNQSGISVPGVLTTRTFLEMGSAGMNPVLSALKHKTGPRIKKANVTLKAPITDPEKVICIGMNYVDHCTEQNVPIPEVPIVFNKFPSTIVSD